MSKYNCDTVSSATRTTLSENQNRSPVDINEVDMPPGKVVRHLAPWYPLLLAVSLLFAIRSAQRWIIDYFEVYGHRAVFVMVDGLQIILLSAAGAIVRRNWRHVMVMALVGAGACVLLFLAQSDVLSGTLFWGRATVAAWMIVGAELALTGHRDRRDYFWAGLAGLMVGALLAVADAWLACCQPFVNLPINPPWATRLPIGYILSGTLTAFLVWLTITALQIRPARTWSRPVIGIATCAIMLPVASTIAFFTSGLHSLAVASLRNGSPFDVSIGVKLLTETRDRKDRDLIWDAIVRSDWTKYRPQEGSQSEWPAGDWRESAISQLSKLDATDTAARLAKMLQDHPTAYMAGTVAPYLAQARCCDTSAVLLRYAWLGDSRCTNALAVMRIPQVAPVMISELSCLDSIRGSERLINRLFHSVADWRAAQDRIRSELTTLLGKNVGDNPDAWSRYYDSVIDQTPSPLSVQQRNDMARVTRCFNTYFKMRNEWKSAQQEAIRRASSISEAAVRTISSLTTQPPDWNVPTVKALEQEVTAYAERVAKLRNAANRPSPAVPPLRPTIRLLPSDKPGVVRCIEELQNTSDKTVYIDEGQEVRGITLVAEWRSVNGRRQLVRDFLDEADVSNFPICGSCADGSPRQLDPSEKLTTDYEFTVKSAGVFRLKTKWSVTSHEDRRDVGIAYDVDFPPQEITVTPDEVPSWVGSTEARQLADKELAKTRKPGERYDTTTIASCDGKTWEVSFSLQKNGKPGNTVAFSIDRHTGKVTRRDAGNPLNRADQEDDIREAVFRWLFDHNASGQQSRVAAYFLDIDAGNGDPSDAFIKRFLDHKPPVRKKSQCIKDPRHGVLDKTSRKNGLLFYIERIKWLSDAEVEVSGGYYEGPESASTNTYRLKNDGHRWKVTSDRLDGIS